MTVHLGHTQGSSQFDLLGTFLCFVPRMDRNLVSVCLHNDENSRNQEWYQGGTFMSTCKSLESVR